MKILAKLVSVVVLLSLALEMAGCEALQSQQEAAFEASGVIEATEVQVAAEISGRVERVNVQEGQAVQAGQVLFSLEDTLLEVQGRAASAGLDSALASVQTAQAALEYVRAQYDLTLSAAQAEAEAMRQQFWFKEQPGDFELPIWYFTQEELVTAAQTEMERCQQELEAARGILANFQGLAGGDQLLEAERRLAQAQEAFQIAELVAERSKDASDNRQLKRAAQDAFEDARRALEDAQQAYDEALTNTGARDLVEARARYMVAQACHDTASSRLRRLQSGEYSLQVALAEKSVAQAEASLQQAQKAVDQARANLEMVETQMEKLQVNAPISGVVLTRSLQPGEVLQAGQPALTLAQLEELTVTVYISEDRYGQLKLGGSAFLRVDSFPEETFEAHITRIADKAEYTPRNVQTKEERQTTVYAVELVVDNPEGKLKPGMPVDVEFREQ
ncbi:MAG: HlyD family efflux transporter periplasmic adaptor subunit [Anaerolineales bacterium]|nr:MAG: HlyD family efflux transporter periplasmic adaptor subunit [Anaerolineales bacterium]